MRTVSLIDVPVAIFGLVAPAQVRDRAVDVYMQFFGYGSTRFCFGIPPGNLWGHLSVAVPVWIAILATPGLLALAIGRTRSRPAN